MVLLYIIMHGLIALVPLNEADAVNHMTALLVNARTKPAEMAECFEPHDPMLTAKTQTPGECLAAGCSIDGSLCQCDFSKMPRKQVQLGISPEPSIAQHKRFTAAPQNGLPFNQEAAQDFSYVANLTQPPLSAKLNTDFLAQDPQKVPSALIARMTFPFESVTACTLGVRPDEGSRNVHPFAFRPLHDDEKPGELSQALAQLTLASIKVPDGATVTLTISDFDGGNSHTLNLATTVNAATHKPEYTIMLQNSRERDLNSDDLCDDGVGRDFAFFYELVQQPPAWKDRALPHVKFTRWKSARDVEVKECTDHQTFTLTSRPICAMASFN